MWNVETVLDELRKKAPISIQNAITKDVLGRHWTGKEWKKIADQYPATTKGKSLLSFYEIICFPDEALEYFWTWAEKDFFVMLENRRDECADKFAIKIPEYANNTNNVFAGKNICFSGFAGENKKNIENIAKQLKITETDDVTLKTDYLVCYSMNKSHGKRQKAIAKGVQIITAEDFVIIISKKE